MKALLAELDRQPAITSRRRFIAAAAEKLEGIWEAPRGQASVETPAKAAMRAAFSGERQGLRGEGLGGRQPDPRSLRPAMDRSLCGGLRGHPRAGGAVGRGARPADGVSARGAGGSRRAGENVPPADRPGGRKRGQRRQRARQPRTLREHRALRAVVRPPQDSGHAAGGRSAALPAGGGPRALPRRTHPRRVRGGGSPGARGPRAAIRTAARRGPGGDLPPAGGARRHGECGPHLRGGHADGAGVQARRGGRRSGDPAGRARLLSAPPRPSSIRRRSGAGSPRRCCDGSAGTICCGAGSSPTGRGCGPSRDGSAGRARRRPVVGRGQGEGARARSTGRRDLPVQRVGPPRRARRALRGRGSRAPARWRSSSGDSAPTTRAPLWSGPTTASTWRAAVAGTKRRTPLPARWRSSSGRPIRKGCSSSSA